MDLKEKCKSREGGYQGGSFRAWYFDGKKSNWPFNMFPYYYYYLVAFGRSYFFILIYYIEFVFFLQLFRQHYLYYLFFNWIVHNVVLNGHLHHLIIRYRLILYRKSSKLGLMYDFVLDFIIDECWYFYKYLCY